MFKYIKNNDYAVGTIVVLFGASSFIFFMLSFIITSLHKPLTSINKNAAVKTNTFIYYKDPASDLCYAFIDHMDYFCNVPCTDKVMKLINSGEEAQQARHQ